MKNKEQSEKKQFDLTVEGARKMFREHLEKTPSYLKFVQGGVRDFLEVFAMGEESLTQQDVRALLQGLEEDQTLTQQESQKIWKEYLEKKKLTEFTDFAYMRGCRRLPDWKGYEVYEPVYPEMVYVGLPFVFLVKDGKVRASDPQETFDYRDYQDELKKQKRKARRKQKEEEKKSCSAEKSEEAKK